MRKYTDLQKCSICLRGNNFLIEIKKDSEGQAYYMERCPKCSHYEEIKEITAKEVKVYGGSS